MVASQHSNPRRLSTLAKAVTMAAGLAALTALSGCGSSSTDSTVQISGQAVAGAVDGTVTVFNAGGAINSAAVTGGTFQVRLPREALSGDLEFTVTGNYTDEVSGGNVTLTGGNPLGLYVEGGHFLLAGNDNAPVTVGSTVIREMVHTRSMTLTQARSAFQLAFGYLPSMDAVPFDPTSMNATDAAARPSADRDAAFRAGMFSQLGADLGLAGADLADLPLALAADLEDNVLDGVDGTGPVMLAGINMLDMHITDPLAARLLAAHGGFAGSSANGAELIAPSMGLPPMAYDADGTIQRVITATGRTVDVQLDSEAVMPFMPGYWTARTAHRVTLTDVNTAQPVDVTTDADIVGIDQAPFMHMLSGHNHATPTGAGIDASAAASGSYLMDSYYVMASAMTMGTESIPMGVWDYVVRLDEDTDGDTVADASTNVIFHPQVKMPMNGDVLYGKISNAADSWTNMMGMTEPRAYRVWLHEATANGDGTHQLTLFISTRNMAMNAQGMAMTFPPVFTGQSLLGPVDNMGMRPAFALGAVTVESSTDGGSSWHSLSPEANTGRFTIAALSGLDNATGTDTLTVRLTVGGNVMQTAGAANAQLMFTAP
jgi:hypothetical protein